MTPLVKTAHVSSMVCLTAWSSTHLFFIVLFFSILALPPSSLAPEWRSLFEARQKQGVVVPVSASMH
jgi:hypothetical protein